MQLQKLTYFLISLIIIGYLLHIGSFIILPVLFAAVFATFLYPLDQFLFKKIKVKWISILMSFTLVFFLGGIVFFLFSVHLIDIVQSIPSISNTVQEGLNKIVTYVEVNFGLLQNDSFQLSSSNVTSALQNSIGVFTKGVISSGNLLFNIFLVFILTFFMLYYRKSFKNFIIYRFAKEDRGSARKVLYQIKEMIQAYIGGLGLVILILSVLNSIGLWLIGLEYPVFWGVLGGFLAIIPYIGTVLGGMLPLLYCIATTNSWSQPILILAYYILIQTIEGNLITPKVVGDKVDVNPLVSILALLFFGSFWGIGGIILALPIISIIRIVLSQFEETVDISLLMSSGVADYTRRVDRD